MSRAIKAQAATDLRQGVTEAEHAVLDLVEEIARDEQSLAILLFRASSCAQWACAAVPENFNGSVRVKYAREAAAALICVLNRMDEDGRELPR